MPHRARQCAWGSRKDFRLPDGRRVGEPGPGERPAAVGGPAGDAPVVGRERRRVQMTGLRRARWCRFTLRGARKFEATPISLSSRAAWPVQMECSDCLQAWCGYPTCLLFPVPGWCASVRRSPILPLAPDLAVEVLSEGNTPREMARKVSEYFDGDCRLVWLVDPRTRTVTVFTSAADEITLTEKQTLTGGDVLPGFRLPLRKLFGLIDGMD